MKMSDSVATEIGLPPEVRDRSAWYGPEIAQSGEWIERLSEQEIDSVRQAVSIRATKAQLPMLAPRLHAMRDEVLNGRGFVLIKGLPVEDWSKRELALAFLIIGAQLGALRMQNAAGHVLGHVRDLGRSSADPNTRIYQTRERQTFHTDSCDIVALLCLKTARNGGLSALVSAVTIYNEIRRLRPDLLAALFAPIETDRRGEVPAGAKPYFRIPVFSWHAGLLSVIYQRQYIESARRFPDVA